MATAAQVVELELQWERDPVWELSETEGFEDHRDELARFAGLCRMRWERRHAQRVAEKAEALGIPGMSHLAAYVLDLEARLDAMQAEIRRALGDGR